MADPKSVPSKNFCDFSSEMFKHPVYHPMYHNMYRQFPGQSNMMVQTNLPQDPSIGLNPGYGFYPNVPNSQDMAGLSFFAPRMISVPPGLQANNPENNFSHPQAIDGLNLSFMYNDIYPEQVRTGVYFNENSYQEQQLQHGMNANYINWAQNSNFETKMLPQVDGPYYNENDPFCMDPAAYNEVHQQAFDGCITCSKCTTVNKLNVIGTNKITEKCTGCGEELVIRAEDETLLIKQDKTSTPNRKSGAECSNCKATETTLWRRTKENEIVCNACGLYQKLHDRKRPLSMKKDEIKTRVRKLSKKAASFNFHDELDTSVDNGGQSISKTNSLVKTRAHTID